MTMKRKLTINRGRRTSLGKTRREISKMMRNENVKCKMRLGEIYTDTLIADGIVII